MLVRDVVPVPVLRMEERSEADVRTEPVREGMRGAGGGGGGPRRAGDVDVDVDDGGRVGGFGEDGTDDVGV